MFISEAFAQTADAAAGGGSGFSFDALMQSPILPFIPIFIIMYFMMIRPQQKRAKALRDAVGNLRRGDRVLLQGGILGKIANVPAANDSELSIEIADKVQIKVTRGAIAEVLEKTQPVSAAAEEKPAKPARASRKKADEAPAAAAETENKSE